MTVDCRLADLAVRFCAVQKEFAFRMHRFTDVFETPDITVTVLPEDVAAERALDSEYGGKLPDPYYEETAAFRKLGEQLPHFSVAVFHCAMIDVAGRGVAFAARSGTGKTTHMNLWQQLLGDRMTVVNGDKPFVRVADGDVTGYGSPWRGKENLGGHDQTALTDICRIVRSETNETVPLSKQEAVDLLLGQIYMPQDPAARAKTLAMIEKLADSVRAWEIRCNMDPAAAEVAYRAVFGDGELPKHLPEQRIEYYHSPKICAGCFTPEVTTGKVFLPLPFLPFKVMLSCPEILCEDPPCGTDAIITEITIDFTQQQLTVCGMAYTAEKISPFAMRPNKAGRFISYSESGIEISPVTLGGYQLCFSGGHTYEWTAVGE